MKRLIILAVAAAFHVCSAGVVEEWNQAFEQSVQVETSPPALAARNLAILHVAIHDAYAGCTGKRTLLLAEFDPPADVATFETAACAAAGHRVCEILFPSRKSVFTHLLTGQLEDLPPTETRRRAQAFGRAVAEMIMAARSKDGSATSVHYVPQSGPRQWRRTTKNRPPELPHWPKVQPFVLDRAGQFRPNPPPRGQAFQAALDVVKRMGAAESTTRTTEQTEIARFWSDFNYTSTPPGHWNQITRALSLEQDFDLEQSVRLYAVLNLALADAGLAAFDAKYHHNFWRPVTALRAEGDADWQSLLPSPTHPEYVSAHSTFSAAAARVLEEAFPQLEKPFVVKSDTLPGVIRHFDSFLACEAEVGISRIYGGIHYGFSNLEGRKLGRRIAEYVLKLHPLRDS